MDILAKLIRGCKYIRNIMVIYLGLRGTLYHAPFPVSNQFKPVQTSSVANHSHLLFPVIVITGISIAARPLYVVVQNEPERIDYPIIK